MHESPRFTVSRSLIVLVPKQPVLDWIQRVDPEPLRLTLGQLRKDQDVFLIAQGGVESAGAARHWVWQRWETFFERYMYD